MVIDPVARRADGESARIAKDVLCAGAAAKVCYPESPEEYARALALRGRRRPVVVGDDRSLMRVVALLHRERELSSSVLSVVPVGGAGAVRLVRSLGVPTGAVAAARAVLEGTARRLDLLVDDSDGVVLTGLRIPVPVSAVDVPPPGRESGSRSGTGPWWAPPLRTCQSLVRTLTRPAMSSASGAAGRRPTRLRVEADGVTLIDLDQPVEGVSVTARNGLAEVEVRPTAVGAQAGPVRATARTVTVSGPDFRYRADAAVSGPVRTRTWTVRPGAWSLTLPAAGPGEAADAAAAPQSPKRSPR
ncbi:diacylglycerol kinase [Streptomyces sp. GC420]|nr:diacylglycerol kinase [Streptomyces sp. GC420]